MTLDIRNKRSGTAAEWTAANRTLGDGETGVETDTGKTKTGDGVTAWADLEYDPGSGGSGASGAVVVDTVHVSAADLLALTDSNPLEIVADPGAGKFIYVQNTWWSWHPGSTPYTLFVDEGSNPPFLALTTAALWGGGVHDILYEHPATGLLDSAEAQLVLSPAPQLGGKLSANSNVRATVKWQGALLLQNDRAGNYTDGDGTLDISVAYIVADL